MAVAVDSPRGKQPHKMQGRPFVPARGHGLDEPFILLELALPHCFADSGHILVNNASCTDIQMPNIGVPHLTFHQAHGLS